MKQFPYGPKASYTLEVKLNMDKSWDVSVCFYFIISSLSCHVTHASIGLWQEIQFTGFFFLNNKYYLSSEPLHIVLSENSI